MAAVLVLLGRLEDTLEDEGRNRTGEGPKRRSAVKRGAFATWGFVCALSYKES